ncbi:MAG: polysaccharide deacetylase family protein [Chitinophagales bacterium]|nr:polysaccharide deacetylase family protein [Chitinophagales bacterium]
MYFVKTPIIYSWLFPNVVWKMPNNDNAIFLSFDDGPNPNTTPFILKTLQQYNAKASFFCLGRNVEQYPDLTQQIVAEGHLIANHGYEHLDAWKINRSTYLENIDKGKMAIQQISNQEKIFFRPPYGKFKLVKHIDKIINYSIMCGDFDSTISSEQCLKNITDNLEVGSIVCMHDNDKATEKIQFVLPQLLSFVQQQKMLTKIISF